MSLDWPASLPQSAAYNTFAPGLVNSAMRTEMEQGPAKTRQRFKVGSKVDRVLLHCTAAQWATLETFFQATTAGGSLQFTMFDPRGGSDREVRFASPPTPSPNGFDNYQVALEIEVLP